MLLDMRSVNELDISLDMRSVNELDISLDIELDIEL